MSAKNSAVILENIEHEKKIFGYFRFSRYSAMIRNPNHDTMNVRISVVIEKEKKTSTGTSGLAGAECDTSFINAKSRGKNPASAKIPQVTAPMTKTIAEQNTESFQLILFPGQNQSIPARRITSGNLNIPIMFNKLVTQSTSPLEFIPTNKRGKRSLDITRTKRIPIIMNRFFLSWIDPMSKEKIAVITMTRIPKETIPNRDISGPAMKAAVVSAEEFVASAAATGWHTIIIKNTNIVKPQKMGVRREINRGFMHIPGWCFFSPMPEWS
jgi:hypothetical protein